MSTIRSIFSSRLIPGLRQFLFWPEINHGHHAFFAAFHWLFIKPGTEDSSFPLEAHCTLKPAEGGKLAHKKEQFMKMGDEGRNTAVISKLHVELQNLAPQIG